MRMQYEYNKAQSSIFYVTIWVLFLLFIVHMLFLTTITEFSNYFYKLLIYTVVVYNMKSYLYIVCLSLMVFSVERHFHLLQ